MIIMSAKYKTYARVALDVTHEYNAAVELALPYRDENGAETFAFPVEKGNGEENWKRKRNFAKTDEMEIFMWKRNNVFWRSRYGNGIFRFR